MADTEAITDMSPHEVGQVALLVRLCPGAAPWSAEALSGSCASGILIRVARDGERFLGMIAFRIAADEAEILNLAVVPLSRRQGIGTRLLESALGECRRVGVKRLHLEVRDSNSAAQAFYRRFGFEEVGRRSRYYTGPVEDALLLSCSL